MCAQEVREVTQLGCPRRKTNHKLYVVNILGDDISVDDDIDVDVLGVGKSQTVPAGTTGRRLRRHPPPSRAPLQSYKDTRRWAL